MAESTISARDSGKSDDDDDDETMAPVSEEHQSSSHHSSGKNSLPIKKRRGEEDGDDSERKLVPEPSSKTKVSLLCDDSLQYCCLSKTLNSDDVAPINPELHVSAFEASTLARSLKIMEYPPGSYKKLLVVFDEANRQYSMALSCHSHRDGIVYSISSEWDRFLMVHNLEAGDKISLYGIPHEDDSYDNCHYMLKYVKKKRVIRFKYNPNKNKQTVTIRPGSRVMTREAYCLMKTLTSMEVVGENAKLYFDSYDANVLITDCPGIRGRRRLLGKYSKDLLVFDGEDRKYTMNFSHCVSGGEISRYCLNSDWNRFLRAHCLKKGDVLTFYRFRDLSVSQEYYYVLRYFRKPVDVDVLREKKLSDDESTDLKVVVLSKKNEQGPGSRALTCGSYCLSKTLSTLEVGREGHHPRLYFDSCEASCLTGCPRSLDEYPFVVFDADDRTYDMFFSHFETHYGEIIYTLDCGWERFVKTHNLKGGDEIFMYRIQNTSSVYDDCCYIIKYTRKPRGLMSGLC